MEFKLKRIQANTSTIQSLSSNMNIIEVYKKFHKNFTKEFNKKLKNKNFEFIN